MKTEQPQTSYAPTGRAEFSKRLLLKSAILALLFLVAGFTTLAKNSVYYPKSHPTHYVSIASKARVAQAPAEVEQAPLVPAARVVPPQPVAPVSVRPHERDEAPPIFEVGLILSLQHRSPPSSLL